MFVTQLFGGNKGSELIVSVRVRAHKCKGIYSCRYTHLFCPITCGKANQDGRFPFLVWEIKMCACTLGLIAGGGNELFTR